MIVRVFGNKVYSDVRLLPDSDLWYSNHIVPWIDKYQREIPRAALRHLAEKKSLSPMAIYSTLKICASVLIGSQNKKRIRALLFQRYIQISDFWNLSSIWENSKRIAFNSNDFVRVLSTLPLVSVSQECSQLINRLIRSFKTTVNPVIIPKLRYQLLHRRK